MYKEEAEFYLARMAMEKGEDEEAIQGFSKVSNADASFYQAKVRD